MKSAIAILRKKRSKLFRGVALAVWTCSRPPTDWPPLFSLTIRCKLLLPARRTIGSPNLWNWPRIAVFRFGKAVLRVTPGTDLSHLAGALKETFPHLPADKALAIVCAGQTCLPPATDAAQLSALLEKGAAGIGRHTVKKGHEEIVRAPDLFACCSGLLLRPRLWRHQIVASGNKPPVARSVRRSAQSNRTPDPRHAWSACCPDR